MIGYVIDVHEADLPFQSEVGDIFLHSIQNQWISITSFDIHPHGQCFYQNGADSAARIDQGDTFGIRCGDIGYGTGHTCIQ